MVAHGLCISSAGKKDTLVNIEQTKQWVYNVLSESWINQANACAEQFEPEVNELEAAGLSTLPCAKIAVPRIKDPNNLPVPHPTTKGLIQIRAVKPSDEA